MMAKDVIRPVLLKFGVVLAFSLGGILYSILRTKRIKPSRSSSSKSQPSPEHGNQAESGEARAEFRNDGDHVLQKTHSSSKFPLIARDNDEESSLSKSSSDNFACHFSPGKRSNGDQDVYLLPEFNDLVKEFDLAAMKASFSPRKDAEMLLLPKSEINTSNEKGDHEEEIRRLRNMVRTLKERERSLEIQLLEYYGLKEQETAVMELQNRLKINNVEAKLFNLKIGSLHADKKRLEEQVADYAKVVSELEAAKVKIKLLKKELRFGAERNKEHILALQERVVKLQDQETKAHLMDLDVQLKLQKLKDLEAEAGELRSSNHSLGLENSSLAKKLEFLQNLATSVFEDEQTEALKEESQRLRQQNEDLARELERLQADRCTDIEELVYLRWINACLRYELRNCQPGHGKTIARDLSKSLSPKSEERAKQLILEYARKEGKEEKGMIVPDIDSDQWSSSQASYLTDSGELDDSSVEISSPNKTNTLSKSKMFGKLMKLLRGHNSRRSSSLDTATCIDDIAGRSSSVVSLGCNSAVPPGRGSEADRLNIRSRTSSQSSSRLSLDLQISSFFQGSRSTKGEDNNDLEGLTRNRSGGSSRVYKVISPISEDSTYLPQDHGVPEDGQKSELVKYAEALKDSRPKSSFRRRSSLFSSF